MFDDCDWVVGHIDVEFGMIELHNIYSREKIYVPLPDGDELEAFGFNILALMRRAYEKGKEDQRGRDRTSNLRLVANTAGDNAQPDS